MWIKKKIFSESITAQIKSLIVSFSVRPEKIVCPLHAQGAQSVACGGHPKPQRKTQTLRK